jgi:hypothetical protein
MGSWVMELVDPFTTQIHRKICHLCHYSFHSLSLFFSLPLLARQQTNGHQSIGGVLEAVRLAYLGLSWLISSHRILFILPAEHYSFYQPNTLLDCREIFISYFTFYDFLNI